MIASSRRVARAGVVVVNYNGRAVIGRAIACLQSQTRPFDRILVVDNASTDGSIATLPDCVELLALEENVGFAAANNRGIELLADCEWIALVNPDAFLADDWLEQMLTAADQSGAASLACLLIDERDHTRLDGFGDAYHLSGLAWRHLHGAPRSMAPDAPAEILGPGAAAALYRRDAFLEVGGFEERYFCYFEDVDLALRLRLRGYTSIGVPSALAFHQGSTLTGVDSSFTIYHVHRNLGWTFVRAAPTPLVRYIPQHVLIRLVGLVMLARAGHLRTGLRANRDSLRALPWALRTRREIQAGTRITAAEFSALVSRGLRGYLAAQREVRSWR